ncbi:MAG: T9SS type A sorting domain-containing protein [Saprospiraceae bacterium]|nr:T9SS type A sorting domain-containing protein [Candidatus Vicinibacter proximus]
MDQQVLVTNKPSNRQLVNVTIRPIILTSIFLYVKVSSNRHRFIFSILGRRIYQGMTVKVFPNPASYSISLSSEKEVGPTLIQILNLTGNIFYSELINGLKSHVIPCDQWPQGIYLIKILDAHQNIQTFKLMIAKQ